MAEEDGGRILSPSEKALEEKYKRIRSSVESRKLDTFQAKDLPHLLRLMDSSVPDKDNEKLMESLKYFENPEVDGRPLPWAGLTGHGQPSE